MNIYDIAEEAGVSIATISRVINGKAVVSQKTKDKVETVLKKYNYTPSDIARGLVVNSMRIVGVMTIDIRDLYYANVAYTVEQELTKLGFTGILCNTGENHNEKIKYFKTLEQKKVDGIILVGSVFKDKALEIYIKKIAEKIPVVMINGFIESKNVYSIICDDGAGVCDAVEFLIKSGRKSLIYFQDTTTFSAVSKLNAFKKTMENNNFELNENNIIKVEMGLDGGLKGIRQVLERGIRFDAVVCGDDITAVGVVKGLKDAKIKIPEDIAVVGFNNSLLSRCCEPELTSIDGNMEEMGRLAVEIFDNVINGEKIQSQKVIKPELILRKTT